MVGKIGNRCARSWNASSEATAGLGNLALNVGVELFKTKNPKKALSNANKKNANYWLDSVGLPANTKKSIRQSAKEKGLNIKS